MSEGLNIYKIVNIHCLIPASKYMYFLLLMQKLFLWWQGVHKTVKRQHLLLLTGKNSTVKEVGS